MNDLQIGRVARALRHRLRITQSEAGTRAGISCDRVSWIERGRLQSVPTGKLRRLFAVYDAELIQFVRWRGGEVDRLLDRGHAALAELVLQRLEGLGWVVLPEVSFSEYGERGSIDLLAWHEESGTLLVIEIKTELTSVEETLRRHDAKVRLASKLARERFGLEATRVWRLLVLPDETTPRRHVARHEGVFRRAYPLRGRECWRHLSSPAGSQDRLSGLLFLSSNSGTRTGQRLSSRKRITPRRKAG